MTKTRNWKDVLGEPGSVTMTVYPALSDTEYGGGPDFDRTYTTPRLQWRLESRNVGQTEGHMARLIVTRNETCLPWTTGWTQEDQALEALVTAAMFEIDATKFPLGQLVATPGALCALARTGQSALELLERHRGGDWGDLDQEDKAANNRALKEGSRLLSAYHLKDKTKVWLITEADRSATTLLLPEEY